MEKLEYKGIKGPHVYDQGIIYQDNGVQGHICHMTRFFDSESEDATGRLYAAALDLLEAVIFCRSVIHSQGMFDRSEQLAFEKAEKAINKALTPKEA